MHLRNSLLVYHFDKMERRSLWKTSGDRYLPACNRWGDLILRQLGRFSWLVFALVWEMINRIKLKITTALLISGHVDSNRRLGARETASRVSTQFSATSRAGKA